MHYISPLRFVTVFSASILHWIAAEKVNTPVKKRFSHQEFGKSREKRDFYIALPKKNIYHYAILCITMDLFWIIFASYCIRIVYNVTVFPYCISSTSLFPVFYYLLSQPFWFFKCYFVLYIYILWFYALLSLRCFGSAFLYMAVFFPLFFRSFDVETSFWCR